MPKFIFAYHGGSMPDTPEEGAKVMAAWTSWYGEMGAAVDDGGAPCGASQTVTSGGVEAGGGSNPLSGYTTVNAATMDAAIALAKGCPILDAGGSVEVCECMEM